MTPFSHQGVADVFNAYPQSAHQPMLELRELVFETALENEGVGILEETLKWGVPSYLTTKPKSGTTIRLDWKSGTPGSCAVFFHCQTTLIAHCRQVYPETFVYEGNRCLSFGTDNPMPVEELKHCFALALTYHQKKSR